MLQSNGLILLFFSFYWVYFSLFFSFQWSLAARIQRTSLSLLTRPRFFVSFLSLTYTFIVGSFLFTIVPCFIKCGAISSFVASTTIITCVIIVLSFGRVPVISGIVSFVFFAIFSKCLLLRMFAISAGLCSEVVSNIFVCIFVSLAFWLVWIVPCKFKLGCMRSLSLNLVSFLPHIKTCWIRLSVSCPSSLSCALWWSPVT